MLISYVLLGKIPIKPTLLKRKVPSDTRRILGYFYDQSADLHLRIAFSGNTQKENLRERVFMIIPLGEHCNMEDDCWVYIGSASGTFLFMKIEGPSDAKYWRFIPDA